ncbi:Hsp20/alpha crystallin family protein [Bacillaceae bacterium W0354]
MNNFSHMHQWKDNIDKFFGETFWGEFDQILKPLIPQVNILKKEYEILCIINIPGISDLKQIDCSVSGRTLQISGEINIHTPGFEMIQEEIAQGSFNRMIELPYHVRQDKIQARYKNGLVWIMLYKDVEVERNLKPIDIQGDDE